MRRRWQDILPDILVIFAALAAMGPIISNEFAQWDDQYTIFGNVWLNPPSWSGVAFYWQHSAGGLYVPLTYTFWSALAAVAHTSTPGPDGEHLNPMVFHLASVLLHAASALLVLRILRRLKFDALASVFGAMLFAAHPLQVETVAWASGAKDLLSAMFSLVVIWQYACFRESNAKAKVHYAIALLAMLLAMLAKPSAMVTPVILLILDRLVFGQSWKEAIRSLWPFVVIALPLMVIARLVQTSDAVPNLPMWTRPLIAGDALAFYLKKLLIPLSLCLDYGRSPAAAMKLAWPKFAWAMPVVLAFVLWKFRGRAPRLLAAAMIFLISLLPVLGLTPFMYQAHSTVADHYMYLPMLGVAMALACAVQRWPRLWPGAGVMVVVWIILSNLQARTWADEMSLFSQAVRVAPQNAISNSNLGNALAKAGDMPAALEHFQKAVALDPQNHLARLSLAQADLQLGDYSGALAQARISMTLLISDEEPGKEHLIAGLALMQLRRFAEAAAEFAGVLQTEPDNGKATEQLKLARELAAATQPATRNLK